MMTELILNGLRPKALIFERREEIMTLGVMVAEVLFSQAAPVVTLSADDFCQIMSWNGKPIYIRDGEVSEALLKPSPIDEVAKFSTNFSSSSVQLTVLSKSAF